MYKDIFFEMSSYFMHLPGAELQFCYSTQGAKKKCVPISKFIICTYKIQKGYQRHSYGTHCLAEHHVDGSSFQIGGGACSKLGVQITYESLKSGCAESAIDLIKAHTGC